MRNGEMKLNNPEDRNRGFPDELSSETRTAWLRAHKLAGWPTYDLNWWLFHAEIWVKALRAKFEYRE